MIYRKIIRSVISYIPLAKRVLSKKGTGGTNSAEYCKKIWNNHKKSLIKTGVSFPIRSLGEIGPGDSLGVGFEALLEGTDSYVALDAIAHADISNNYQVFNDLKELYVQNNPEGPDDKKVNTIIDEVLGKVKAPKYIKYSVPWWEEQVVEEESLDLIISNAVMEHVDDLQQTYKTMYKWLVPGGYCSHIIDYGAHEFSIDWYKHLYYNNMFWKFLLHGRKYSINRLSHSFQVEAMQKAGFEILLNERMKDKNVAERNKVNSRIRSLFSDEDLETSSGQIIARKPSKSR